jgi:hypothetical protein
MVMVVTRGRTGHRLRYNHGVSEARSASVFKGEVREPKHTVPGPLQTAGSNPIDRGKRPTFHTRPCLTFDGLRSSGM